VNVSSRSLKMATTVSQTKISGCATVYDDKLMRSVHGAQPCKTAERLINRSIAVSRVQYYRV